MKGLILARIGLGLSMVGVLVALLLGKTETASFGVSLTLGLVAGAGLVFSATSWVAFQIFAAVRNQVSQNG